MPSTWPLAFGKAREVLVKDLESLRRAHTEDERLLEELRSEREAPLELLRRLKRLERPREERTKARSVLRVDGPPIKYARSCSIYALVFRVNLPPKWCGLPTPWALGPRSTIRLCKATFCLYSRT